MNIKLYLQVIFFLLVISKSFGQITLELDEIYLNNQTTIENCNTVDFGTVSNNSLVFYYTLSKDVNLAVSTGTIKVKLKYDSNSSGVEKASQSVQSSSWTNTDLYSHTISANIQASDIQVSGSSILLEFIESGITYKSCEYALIKTPVPAFSLSPSNLSLNCGNTSSKTFTVTSANIPSGANVTYQWSYNGWSLVSSTASSRTLQPTSGTNLPSSVSVTPSIDGVPQSTKTATVSLSSFNPRYSISGRSEICTSATYSINNLASDLTVTWSSSNNFIASINPTNGTQATLTKIGTGIVTISATVQNACGQQKTFTKGVVLGNADVDWVFFSNGIGESDYFCSSNSGNDYEILPKISGSNHQVRIKEYPSLNVVYTSYIKTGNLGTLNYNPAPGWYVFEVRRTNSCGTTNWFGAEVEFVDCSQQGGGGMEYRISPNPTSETLTISKKQSKEGKNVSKLKNNAKDSYELYDYNGNLTDKGTVNDETNIDVSNYKKGRYFLKINSSKKSKVHQIIIE